MRPTAVSGRRVTPFARFGAIQVASLLGFALRARSSQPAAQSLKARAQGAGLFVLGLAEGRLSGGCCSCEPLSLLRHNQSDAGLRRRTNCPS